MKRENAGVANNILCREITVGAVDEEFVEEGNPNDDNGSEGEGVPVAEVIREEVSVDASVAGNLKVSEHNNEMSEMSTWEVSLQNLPIELIMKVYFTNAKISPQACFGAPTVELGRSNLKH